MAPNGAGSAPLTSDGPPPSANPAAHDPHTAALAFVAARSAGPPLDGGAQVTVNFHPDRLAGGVPLLRALAADGRWRSQFETGTSNGGLTAHPGGDRWRWERRLFGGAYDDAPAAARPIYGALNHRQDPVGAAPRFGSAHLVLRPEVLQRCTLCWPDSVFEPAHFGVAAACDLVDRLRAAPPPDPLDAYVEAHVHGPLRLPDDVAAIVLDACFRGTAVEADAHATGCAVTVHAGFRLPLDVLAQHADYRGAEVVALGQALAHDGVLSPDLLGRADADPMHLKQLWHCLARFGRPAHDAPSP